VNRIVVADTFGDVAVPFCDVADPFIGVVFGDVRLFGAISCICGSL
jgi:hypothetical protein